MAKLSHLAWPYQLGVDLEQDSDAELMAAAAVVACTPRGHRDDDPAFGVTVPVFVQGLIDTERLADEIASADERLDVDAEEILDLTNATVRLVQTTVHSA